MNGSLDRPAAEGPTSDRRSEGREYRSLTHEIDRLLGEGRLAEARVLNGKARVLFRTLNGASAPGVTRTDGPLPPEHLVLKPSVLRQVADAFTSEGTQSG